MDITTEVPMPSYFIYRETMPGQVVNPNAPLVFWPPKDSDELFDALRIKYPHLRTHSERMREAVFEFLLEEQAPQLSTEQLPTPQLTNSALTSPWEASMHSMSSESSTWDSPDAFDLATPTFGNSPQPQAQQLSRELSTRTTSTTSGQPSPPALEQMTGVFSLSDSTQPKQRVRRKMTEAEKVEYRKRRIVKACDKCAKRKRKCQHNQPEMESVGGTKANKVTKAPATPAARKSTLSTPPKTQEREGVYGANVTNIENSFQLNVPGQEYAEYSALVGDPLPDMGLDDLLSPPQPQWPWSDTPDWTLMDFSSDNCTSNQSQNNRIQQNQNLPNYEVGLFDETFISSGGMLDFNFDHFASGDRLDDGHAAFQQIWPTSQPEQPQERQQATHTVHVHDAEGRETYQRDAQNQSTWTATSQFLPEQQGGDLKKKNRTRRSTAHASLSQMTLRLTATAKAVKAFGRLLQPQSPSRSRLQSISLRKIAVIALGGQCLAQQATLHRGTEGIENRAISVPSQMRQNMCMHPRGSSHTASDEILAGHHHSEQAASGPLEGMTIGDYLRMHTNKTPVQEDGRSAISVTLAGRQTQQQLDATSAVGDVKSKTQRDVVSESLSKHPVLGSSGTDMLQHPDSAAQEGRQVPSLGEGITTSKSPSTELFMLKRRIPKALHSVVDRNIPSASLGPLLTTIPENVDTLQREATTSRNIQCTEGNTTSRNGGAYQTLERPVLADGLASIESALEHVHARACNSTASTYSGETDQYHGSNPTDLRRHLDALARSTQTTAFAANVHYTGRDANLTPATATAASNNQQGASCENDVYNERLNDTMRRRDHFGRSSFLSSALEMMLSVLDMILALVTLIKLLNSWPVHTTNLSFLLLAIVLPIPGSKGAIFSQLPQFASKVWTTALQRMILDRSWWAGINSAAVRIHGPAQVYVRKQLLSSCG